jgi:glycosyltransferase involved in cell wall biosynthesis
VGRLIDACRRADVELWIAGNPGSTGDFDKLRARASGHRVRFLGFQSDEALVDLMSKVKVFALPSLNEGVGLAALEAAALGCEIVVTSRGGPPDYFGRLAHYVNPFSVEDIASKLKLAVHGPAFQLGLSEFLSKTVSAVNSSLELERAYSELVTSSAAVVS